MAIMPERVEECVSSVMDDNPEYSKSRAYAICNAMQNKGELSGEYDENPDHDALLQDAAENGDCPDGQVRVGDRCLPVEEVDDVPPSALDMSSPRILSIRQLAGPIERVENSDGSVTYKNLKILSRGVWTDASSKEPTEYIPKNLDIAEDNTVNIMHDADNDVSAVGHIEADSANVEDHDLYADVTLAMDSPASEYADENLQKTLETKGEKGFGGPSVEIPGEGLELDYSGEYPKVSDGVINGLGFVKSPAAKTTAFSQQTRERSVAMSAEDGQEAKAMYQKRTLMEPDDVRDRLEQAGVDTSDMSDEDVVSMAESLHGDLMDMMDADMEEYEDDEEEEEDADMADDENNEEGEDEEDMEEEDAEMQDDAVDVLEEQIDDLWGEIEDMKEAMMSEAELSEALEDTREELADAETASELAEATEELDKRLSELEEEPEDPKTLADSGDGDEWDPVYDDTPASTTTF